MKGWREKRQLGKGKTRVGRKSKRTELTPAGLFVAIALKTPVRGLFEQ